MLKTNSQKNYKRLHFFISAVLRYEASLWFLNKSRKSDKRFYDIRFRKFSSKIDNGSGRHKTSVKTQLRTSY